MKKEKKFLNKSNININITPALNIEDMSEITISHKSKGKEFRDIFDESTFEDVEEMESNAINNKNNMFYDPNNESIHRQIFPVCEVDERSVNHTKTKES